MSNKNELPDNFAALPPSQISDIFAELIGRHPSDEEINMVFLELESDMNIALDRVTRNAILSLNF